MIKRLLTIVVLLSFFAGFAQAKLMEKGAAKREIEQPQSVAAVPNRIPPSYTFSRTPQALMTSYYDYMMGSYNGLPLQIVPDAAGGGYFMTYHGKRNPTSTRRVFYAYINSSGVLVNNNEITYVNNSEGYPTMVVDPVSGKPLYAWHANTDADPEFEVQFVSDAFLMGISGLFSDVETVIDNPITMQSPSGQFTYDNEFIWPTAITGPSPVANKRRVYVLGRNSADHSYAVSENPYIAYADFNGDDIEIGIPFVWNYTSIPEMNAWNVGTEWRRPFHSITCDDQGNLYYAGYHLAMNSNGSAYIDEPEMDVFKCPNYGQGTWIRESAFSNLPTWNPPSFPGGPGHFLNEGGIPYADNELTWSIINSSHLNAIVDDLGRIHVPATFAFGTTQHSYYPALQVMKEFVFNPNTNQFAINDVFPRKNPDDTYNQCFQPWDRESPWGVPEYNNGELLIEYHYPFPYWDDAVHLDAMMFHYNNLKMTQGNGEGMLAIVWQDSQRARMINEYGDLNYSSFADTPEICISVSPDNGETWSDPIIINNVETPQFSGLKPMWVYPANKIKYTGMQGNQKVGKLGLMFFNDYTWGSNVIDQPVHYVNDGGQVMFAELEIIFPESGPAPTDPFGSPLILSGSMSVMAQVSINNVPATDGDILAAFVTVDGIQQLRGKTPVQVISGVAGCLLQVFTENNDEVITFKVWNHSNHQILSDVNTLVSEVNGTVGSYPNNLYQINAGMSTQQVASPTFNPPAGTYSSGRNVTISSTTPGAQMRYTINGAEPTLSSTLYSAPVQINSTTTLKAKAFLSGWEPSATTMGVYTITGTLATPVFAPAAGTYTTAQNVTIACATGGSQIRYTTNGSEPGASSTLYNAPIPISATTTLKARAFLTGWEPSVTATGVYTITGTVATPVFAPAAGTYTTTQNITIGCATGGSNIRYTTNGTEPTASSTLYNAPIPINTTTTLKAKAFLNTWAPSATATGVYTITGTVAAPEFSPEAGEYTEPVDVVITCATPAVQIRYTTDDTEPGPASTLYTAAIHLVENTTVKAKAFLAGWEPSATATVYYEIKVGNPDGPEAPIVTGIQEVYPNPCATNLTLKLGTCEVHQDYQLKIYNIRGRRVYHAGGNAKGNFELTWDGRDDSGARLAPGVYLISFTTGKQQSSRKVVLQ